MSLTPIDEIIARTVGDFSWYLLPDMHAGLKRDEMDERFRSIWDPSIRQDLKQLLADDALVDYPVINLGIDVLAGIASRPFIYPRLHDERLPLSEYLGALTRFLTLQLTGSKAHIPLIWNAVRTLASVADPSDLLDFVDQLWRGRWIIDAFEWAQMRISVITGGTEDSRRKLERDTERMEAEALRLIKTERLLKDSVRSTDEWLHETYCQLPDISTWLAVIRRGNEVLKSDELSKLDRVLDEFLADMHTTLSIPCHSLVGGRGLVDEYAIKPLIESGSIEKAIIAIRGIYRGRSIIPKIWYEIAKEALQTLESRETEYSKLSIYANESFDFVRAMIPADKYARLEKLDLVQAFGRAITKDGRDNHWMLLGDLFDYWGGDEKPATD